MARKKQHKRKAASGETCGFGEGLETSSCNQCAETEHGDSCESADHLGTDGIVFASYENDTCDDKNERYCLHLHSPVCRRGELRMHGEHSQYINYSIFIINCQYVLFLAYFNIYSGAASISLLEYKHMNDEKWNALLGQIKDSFEVVRHETLKGELPNEITEELVFVNPVGTMKLSRHTKPRVIGEKTFYAGRGGTNVGIQKEYSDTETADVVQLFREAGDDWEEMDLSALG